MRALSERMRALAAELEAVSRHRDELLEAQRATKGARGDAKQDIFFEFSFFSSFLFYAVSTCAHSAYNCSLCHTLFNLNFTHSG
jgi:hypothetical protein